MATAALIPQWNAYGVTAEAGLGYHGHLAAVLGVDATHGARQTGVSVHGGVRLGSYTAVGTSALAALLAFALATALASGN